MEGSTKKKFSFWKLLRNLVIGVVAAVCIIAMGSQDSSGRLQEQYFVGLYRINGTDYYTNSERFLMRWYWDELWQDEEGDDIRIHRFPEGTIPTWSEEHQAFFYLKGRTVYRWDLETDKSVKVYTMEAPSLWEGVQDFFLTRVNNLWKVTENHLLLRRSDGTPILVDLTSGQEVVLERVKGYTSVSVLDDYLIFSGYEKPLYIISRDDGETVNSLPFESFSVDMLDTCENQLLFHASISHKQNSLWWYDADHHDLQKIVPQEPSQDAQGVLMAQFAWGDVAYIHKGKVYRIDTKGNQISEWELPYCEAIKAFEVAEDYIICAGTSYSPEIESWQRKLTYYQLTQEGEVRTVYEWQPILRHALNDCQVICDGNLVISGCPAEAERIRFTVE